MIREILDHYTGLTKKSSALQPLVFPIVTVSVALVALTEAKAPDNVIIMLAAGLFFIIAVLVIGFLFLVTRNPEALRSETFNPTKARDEAGKTASPPTPGDGDGISPAPDDGVRSAR